jgi:hypothetical protein
VGGRFLALDDAMSEPSDHYRTKLVRDIQFNIFGLQRDRNTARRLVFTGLALH